MKKNAEKNLTKFLVESNLIEKEYSNKAFQDAYKAWKFLITFDELTFSRILETHRVLMCRLNEKIAGRIRKVDVRVGNVTQPKPDVLEERLERLLEFIPVIEPEIKQWHIIFEKIHPFEDGNGRIGRILMNWQRVKNDLSLLVIHVGEEQSEYYTWFKREHE